MSYSRLTRLIAIAALPVAWVVAPGRARTVACRWALAMRFPHEDLAGLDPATHAAFTAARRDALWRDGVLLGLTSGHRDFAVQQRLYLADQARGGRKVLPPQESRHVSGTALDIRPVEGAGWLSRHGGRYGLYRVYDNEWWHFEYRPDGPPVRQPHPSTVARWPTPDSQRPGNA